MHVQLYSPCLYRLAVSCIQHLLGLSGAIPPAQTVRALPVPSRPLLQLPAVSQPLQARGDTCAPCGTAVQTLLGLSVLLPVQMPVPYYLYAPLMNFAGFNGAPPTSIPAYRWYNEGTTSAVFPRDLYSAQLLARVGAIPAVSTGANQVTYQSPGYGCNGWTRCLINTFNATMAKCPANFTCKSRCCCWVGVLPRRPAAHRCIHMISSC